MQAETKRKIVMGLSPLAMLAVVLCSTALAELGLGEMARVALPVGGILVVAMMLRGK